VMQGQADHRWLIKIGNQHPLALQGKGVRPGIPDDAPGDGHVSGIFRNVDVLVSGVDQGTMIDDHIVGTVPHQDAVRNRIVHPYVGDHDVVGGANIERVALKGNARLWGRRSIDGDEGSSSDLQPALQLDSATDFEDNSPVSLRDSVAKAPWP
jgi:hypothetical protein